MFSLWLSDVLDDCIAVKASSAKRGRKAEARGYLDDIRGYLASIDAMLKARARMRLLRTKAKARMLLREQRRLISMNLCGLWGRSNVLEHRTL